MVKKRKNVRRLMGYSYLMGGTALIGGTLPDVAGTPVKTVATTGSKFVAPMASVTGATAVLKQLKHLKPKKRKRRSK